MNTLKNMYLFFLSLVLFSCTEQNVQKGDPLPSWNEGNTKQSIIYFVNEVTDESSSNFVKPGDRIATFDNDGTLWSEQPYYFQFQFAFDRVKEMAADHPEWKNQQPFKAILENDIKTVMESGMKSSIKCSNVSSGEGTS